MCVCIYVYVPRRKNDDDPEHHRIATICVTQPHGESLHHPESSPGSDVYEFFFVPFYYFPGQFSVWKIQLLSSLLINSSNSFRYFLTARSIALGSWHMTRVFILLKL